MRPSLFALVSILVLGRLTGAQEMTLQYKARQQPLSYGVKLHVTARAKGQEEQKASVLAVLREEKVTMDKDNHLVSQESLSYLDDQGKVMENPEDRVATILTVKKRDTRGNLFPEKRKDEQSPLIWPTLMAPRALPVFPHRKISVGETWSETVPVHSWLHAYDVLVTSKLESVEDRLGHKCAKVSYEFCGHWDVREQPESRKGAIGSGQFSTEDILGSGVVYFAYGVGATIEKEQEMRYILDEHTKYWTDDGKIAMRAENYQEWQFKLDVKLQR